MALEKIDRAVQNGALVYVSREEISELPEQYMPSVTEFNFKKDDFVNVGGDNYYPEKATTNAIAKACGVSYTEHCGTRSKGEAKDVSFYELKEGNISKWQCEGVFTVYGSAQGTKLKPDGSLETSPKLEYEFDVTDRYNIDRLGTDKYPPKNIFDARKKFFELKKFATQRAATGSQLMVVRYLAAIPTAFKSAEILKPMFFCQYLENPEYKNRILNELTKTPDGRLAIANNMMHVKNELFGPPNQIEDTTHQTEPEVITQAAEPTEPEGIFSDQAMKTGELSPLDLAKLKLEEYLLDPIVQKVPSNIQGINLMINNPEVTVEQVNELITTIENWKKKRS